MSKVSSLQYAEALEAVAKFYRENPDMLVGSNIYLPTVKKEEFIAMVCLLAKGGKVTKRADDINEVYPRYHAERDFGGVKICLSIDRKLMCRLVSPTVYDCPDSLLAEGAEFQETEA